MFSQWCSGEVIIAVELGSGADVQIFRDSFLCYLSLLTFAVGLLQLSAKDTSSKLLGSDLKLLPLVEKIY
jgi:hypothetical protein